MTLHPRFRTLVRFVDDELEPDRRTRTAAHLVRCTVCREKIGSLEALSRAAAGAPHPEPPDGALDRVLKGREAGDRVILPVETAGARANAGGRGPAARTVAAAAVVVIVAAALFVWIGPEGAVAGASDLRFEPSRPTAGAEVTVEYRGGSMFPQADTLRLRARLRTPWSQSYNRGAVQITVARLLPAGGDVFRGTFRLPPDVVYGTFAVEDLEGDHVDSNQRRLWELLVHGPDGRPLYDGLDQRIADHMGRNWEVGRETAYWMTELYPERISAWNQQAGFQRESLGPDAFSELRTAHRERYLALHDSLSGAEQVTAEQVHDMANYWWAAGGNYDELDPEIWRYWTGRLREEFPDHPTVLFVGENEIRREHRDDPDARLEAVEVLWRRLENVPPSYDRTSAMQGFINNTLNVVDEGEDPTWFGRWIERFRNYDRPTPEGIAYRVEGVLDRDDLRDQGIRELQRERARIESDLDAFRPLSITRERQRALNDEWAARLLLVMGKGYLAGGDTLVAVDSLELASGLAWSPEVDRLLGEVNLALGDTLAAVRRFAAVAADPGTSESFADSALALVGTGVALEAWQRATDEARARMSRQVLAQADPQPIQGPVRLRDETGAESTLADLADGKPLAVVMFSRHCPWAVQALPEIERLSDLVGARGGRLVVVSEDEPDDELREVLSDNDVDLVPLFDSRREATRAFSNFGTPYHYIIDGDGTLMFKGEGSLGLSRIPLEVEALLQTKEPEGGGGP